MITLWRRIKNGVAGIGDTEWILLGLETIGVIGGVFLAFQLGNWVEESRESRARDALLVRLFEEAEAATYHTERQSGEFAELVDFQRDTLAGWFNEGTCPTERGWTSISAMAMYPALNPPSTAYDEMIGSGGLSLIESPEARAAVAAYHSRLTEHARQLDYFRMSRDSPNRIDVDTGGTVSVDPESGSVSIEGQEFGPACASEKLKIQVASDFRNFRVIQRSRANVAEKARAMCEAVGEEVGRKCNPVAPD